MKIIFGLYLSLLCFSLLNAQNLEVDGQAKILQMMKSNSSDSIVVQLADGTLAIRDKGTLTKNLEDPVGPQDAATKSYVDALITQIMNEFANTNEVFTSPNTGILTDQQGNSYNIIKIGSTGNNSNTATKSNNTLNNPIVGAPSQWWMTENLKVTNYSDNTPISLISDGNTWAGLSTPAFCWYDNNQGSYGETYGALYNYFVGADTNSRNVCPTGWHVPTDTDWSILIANLDPQADPDVTGLNHSLIAGGKMKETGLVHWDAPNEGATNDSGFTALPGGFRSVDTFEGTSDFSGLGSAAIFWSSSSSTFDPNLYGYERALSWDHAAVCRCDPEKQGGYSIRCVRN